MIGTLDLILITAGVVAFCVYFMPAMAKMAVVAFFVAYTWYLGCSVWIFFEVHPVFAWTLMAIGLFVWMAKPLTKPLPSKEPH